MGALDGAVIDLVQRHEGVLHRTDLRAIGVTSRRQERLVSTGVLRPVTSSVFILGRATPDWHQQLRIALAHAGPPSAVSHGSACVLWGLPRMGRGQIEITLPRSARRPARPFGRLHRSRDLDDDQIEELDGLRVTTPRRTLFDMAARLRPVVLDECLQELARRELVTVDGLQADLAARRRSGLTGVTRLEGLLTAVVRLPDVDSWLEARFLRLLVDHDIPLPRTQVWFEVDGHRYRVDTVWEEARLIVELKGHATHATRRQLGEDAAREARLSSLGFEVISFTHDQVVGSPRFVVAQVGQRVHRRAA